MKWLLLVVVVFWALTYWAYKAVDRPGDDFGAVFPFIGAGAVSIALTLVYVALAFWNHSFL